jgi:hypothetical protein
MAAITAKVILKKSQSSERQIRRQHQRLAASDTTSAI